ncbi:MAG: lactate racemase domain-containing protein, partial [Chloroflexota bacterium]
MIAAPDLSAIQLHVPLPVMHRVRQTFNAPVLEDIEGETRRQVRRFADTVKPGARIAITAGSRGIANMARIIRSIGEEVRELGADPFVMPAMGSHGKATAEGQVEMLAELGITEQTVNMSIISDMAVQQVGVVDACGMPVYAAETALQADGVIVVNRVKPHTDFNGPIESGLSKICTIGIGKQKGAQSVHSYGVPGLAQWMPLAAKIVVKQTNVLFGVAIIENAYDQTAFVEAVKATDIADEKERELQAKSKRLMASLPFDTLDVLVIDEMGKQISGAGMDSNIIGRMLVHGSAEFERPNISAIAILDLTDGSHGNAAGLGLADFTTQRLINKVDFAAYYINCLTSGIGGLQRGQVPMVM